MHDDSKRRPGRLTIFLGAAPAVGKTYAMLKAARLRRRDGADIVISLIETHGRQATEELLRDFEIIPRGGIEYRGHVVEEMNIEAILRRDPDLVVVDELAHSNVPGTRNAKRYLDILELIEAGIDVFTTLNVQHIESLGTTVAKITWTSVRETVPDRLLDIADEIEVVDLPPGDLVRKLAEGKIAGGVRVQTSTSFRIAISLRFGSWHFSFQKSVPCAAYSSRLTGQRVPCAPSGMSFRWRGQVITETPSSSMFNFLPPYPREPMQIRKLPECLCLRRLRDCWKPSTSPAAAGSLPASRPEEIARAVEQHQVDLIVMGATGIGPLTGRLLGSVAFSVARNSSAPVTLVK